MTASCGAQGTPLRRVRAAGNRSFGDFAGVFGARVPLRGVMRQNPAARVIRGCCQKKEKNAVKGKCRSLERTVRRPRSTQESHERRGFYGTVPFAEIRLRERLRGIRNTDRRAASVRCLELGTQEWSVWNGSILVPDAGNQKLRSEKILEGDGFYAFLRESPIA